MLTIALIDDDYDYALTLACVLDAFLADMPFQSCVDTYTSLSFDPEAHPDVNIIFLNYHIIPEYAGRLEIAYGNHNLTPLFYIYDYHYRNRKDIHVNHLMCYLYKGRFIDDLSDSFPYSVEEIYPHIYLTYHQHRKLKFIAYDDILYVTRDNDKAVITTRDEIIKASEHFDLLTASFPDDVFFFTTTNRLTNINHVTGYNGMICLDYGDAVKADTHGVNEYKRIKKIATKGDF